MVVSDMQLMRALIVDDHAFIRMSLRGILARFGVGHIEEASDGLHAIDRVVANDAFDIIFCDLQMPGRDGIETLRDLADRGTRAGIVLMSGEDHSILAAAENLAKHHGLRVLGHVAKPISADQIRNFLQAAALPRLPTAAAEPQTPAPGIDNADISRGIAADEFFVLFQPKVSLKTKALWGAEVLVRWRHPRHGYVNPVAFVSIAEQSDIIDQLTEVVLREALKGFKLWRDLGHDVHVAVNLSTHSMVRLELPDLLAAEVTRAGIHPSTVVLEVTESRLADNLPAFLEIATRLRLKGFRLAIDDFGTGFSTLEQVSRLPVSELKIDRAFVAGTPHNQRTRSILEASLALARNLNLTSVCEGVEERDEWDLVERLGADCVQGYFVAKPMAAADIVPWYRRWSATSSAVN